jgi:Holliday junction DNA helicase RuvA
VLHHIRGEVTAHTPGEVIIECGGLGYRVHVSLRTSETLPDRGEVTLLLHQQVKDDGITLFGFGTPAERSIFEHLLQVTGVGAKLAIKILSTLAPAHVARAISAGNPAVIQGVKGVGRRKAELIVATLRDTLDHLVDEGDEAEPGEEPTLDPGDLRVADAILALGRLGYTRKQAEGAIARVAGTLGSEATLEELIRAALVRL